MLISRMLKGWLHLIFIKDLNFDLMVQHLSIPPIELGR